MEYEPGLMWLSGLGEVNYHTLADFRSQHSTKVRAQAGADTFRRQSTLEKETAKARAMIEALEAPDAERGTNRRREAARQRAAQTEPELVH
jgi:hypothetical protein